MRQFTTTEGHKLLVGHDPMGLRIAVVPKEPPLDEGVVDVFGLGINFSNLIRAIREVDLPGGFRGEGWDSLMRRTDGQIHFSFAYKHAPDKEFTTSLSAPDSQQLIEFLQDSVEGRTPPHVESAHITNPSKVGRNDPCPCGSGKKHKKCCGSPTATQSPPVALEVFRAVRDPIAREVLGEGRRRPELLADSGFWMELGCTLGSAEEYPLSSAAFEEALKIDPTNPGLRANYAATLGAAGSNAEALEILEDLPNDEGEFSVIIANILCGLHRETEAIPHYEKAIQNDPDFPFAYERLLDVLKTTGSPLYEYWILRARRQFPDSPGIALAYCHWLISENRLEELAEAQWTDQLKHTPDPRLMGRGQNQPRMIVEVQVLRMIAKSLTNDDLAPLEEAAAVLAAASKDWHLCVPAEQIALAARFFGRRDLVWQASRSFCKACASDRLGPVFLRTLLAQAAASAGDNEQAILDAEAGLKEQPDDLALRNVYWWALDEVGRPDEALEVAKGVQAQISDLPHLCYNIGYMAGKVGKPATAITYYTREIEQETDHAFAFENLALLRLLECDLAAAQQLVKRWKGIVSTDSEPAQVDAKIAKYEQLSTFAEEKAGSVSLSFDLLKLNHTTEPFFGAETKIPPKRPTREEIVAALVGTDPDRKHEISYTLEMEQRGDHSTVVTALEDEVPGIRDLPTEAFISIVEAQSQLEDDSRADFAPCCMAFCKGLEISLFNRVFQPFRVSALALPTVEEMIEQATHPDFEKAASLVRFVSKGAPLELGTMAFTLNLCRGKTAKKMVLLASLREWIESQGYGQLLEQGAADEIREIAKDYRNPAAHSKTFSRGDAAAAKRLCLGQLQKLIGPHSQP